MNRKPPHKPQVPARVPEKPKGPTAPSQWWRPDLLHLAGLMGPWSRGAKIGAAIVGALAVLLGCINLALSTDWIEARVAARIKEKTGRDLTVDGSTLLLFTPGPYVVISDAKVTDPNAKAGADLSIGELKINLGFADLFSRTVEPERVVLVRPVLTLRLGDGPIRWTGGAQKPDPVRFAKAKAASPLPGSARDVHLKDVRIEDGTVVMVRGDTAKEKRIEHIDARLTMPQLTDPLLGRGAFDWKHQTVDFSFEVTRPADLRAGRPARLELAFDTNAIAARFDGTIATAPHLSTQGKLSAKARSIPSVLAWMRESPDVLSALGDGELASDLAWERGEIRLSNARFALKHASGEGQAVIALTGPRPHVRAALALGHLSLDPFLESAKTTEPERGAIPAAEEAAPTPTTRPAPSNDWFSKPVAQDPPAQEASAEAPAPEVEREIAPPTRALALTTPAAAPAAFDADVNLNIRKTRAGRVKIGPSALGLIFRDGVVNVRLGGMALYGGNVRGTLVVDATKPVPGFNGDFHLDGVKAQPFLKDAAQFDMLSGRVKLNLTISGEGGDAGAIKSSLNGDGSLLVTDGAIGGIDVTALIRGLGKGDFDLRQGDGAKTAFSDLGGSFTISDGIAETQNLKVVSPLLKVSADGTVDIARSKIEIMARPEIVAESEGKGGANDLAGLGVPVRIEGPLDAPRVRPQIGSLFAGTESASKTVNKIGEALRKKFKGKPVGEVIGNLLGNVQIGGGGRVAPQALAGPQEADPDQGDADDVMDPKLEEMLR
jgi:AsmA protein